VEFRQQNRPADPQPWAAKPLPKLGLGTAELVVVGDEYERKEGKPMHELLNLPPGRKSDTAGHT
jgi:hypothetical protein